MAVNPIPPPEHRSRVAGAGAIRIVGDPVLAKRADEVEDIDGALVALTGEMLTTMYEAPGLGLAAPQVGVSRRFFVYDVGEGPAVLVNPEITDTDGEWAYAEGCLSIPELTFEVIRPKRVHVTGRDLDGNEVSIEADELLARLFQHGEVTAIGDLHTTRPRLADEVTKMRVQLRRAAGEVQRL